MLALVVANHIQRLEGMDHVVCRHGGHVRQLVDRDLALLLEKDVDDGVLPVGAVGEEAEIGEGFFGGAEFALAFGELVGEGDEELAVAGALVLGEGENTGDVVAIGGFFFFGEVADEVEAAVVAHTHAVEEEGVDVVVEGFVVEEAFGEEAEVAAPGPLATAVNLEEGDFFVAVDFVAGGVEQVAFLTVAFETLPFAKVAEAEFADEDGFGGGEFDGVRGKVPGFDLVGADLDLAEVADSGDFVRGLGHRTTSSKLLYFFFLAEILGFLEGVVPWVVKIHLVALVVSILSILCIIIQ